MNFGGSSSSPDRTFLARSSMRPRNGVRMPPHVRLRRLPRMADFALWATACESAFRPAGTLETAYDDNRRDAIENIVDADPVAAHVRALMADRAQWTGSASDLLQVGINVGGSAMAAWIRSGWPRSPRALAGRLRRAQTPLRALGIEIVFGREGRSGTRTIRITAMGENRTHNTVSTVSRASDHRDRASLNHPPPGTGALIVQTMLTVVTQNSRLPRRSVLSGDRMEFGFGYPHSESVTHVSGTKYHLCLRPLTEPASFNKN